MSEQANWIGRSLRSISKGTRVVCALGMLLILTCSVLITLVSRSWSIVLVSALLQASVLAGGVVLLEVLRRQHAREELRLRSLEKGIRHIAGTVGRSAPLIRALQEQIDTAGASRLSPGKAHSTDVPVSARPTAKRAESPAGHRSSIDEVVRPARLVGALSATRVDGDWDHLIDSEQDPDAWMVLDADGSEFMIEVPGATSAVARLAVRAHADGADPKAAIIWARALSENGDRILGRLLRSWSDEFGSFQYLDNSSDREQHIQLTLPPGCHSLAIGLRSWSRTPEFKNLLSVTAELPAGPESRARSMKDIKVAMILDEFSFNSFRFECTPVVLNPHDWRDAMDRAQPDLFLCESAWSGTDSRERPWKGRIYASENFHTENRHELLAILDYCREKKIPTVFWNKEDPAHFDDRSHDFVRTALLFDHIFTTDAACVERYRNEHAHQSAHCLPFAVQPRLFNPIETRPRTDVAIFAGGWYENHVERSDDMRKIFDGIIEAGTQLKIYDRFFGTNDPLHQFPEKYQANLHPPVDHEAMAEVYRESHIGITINTEKRSTTMFARRIFEMMACNTAVISNYSRGVEEFFGDGVIFLERDGLPPGALSSERLEAHRRQNLIAVLSKHTYAHRLATILQIAGIKFRPAPDLPAIAVRVGDPREASHVLAAARVVPIEGLRIVVLLGRAIPPLDIAAIVAQNNGRNGVVVTAEQFLLDERIDLDELVGADHVYFYEWNGHLPHIEDLKELTLHGQYMDLPIQLSPSASQDFEIREGILGRGSLIPARRLASLLRSNVSTLTYFV